MIFVAIGSNLPHPEAGPPVAVCNAALKALSRRDVTVMRCSRWYASAPVPSSDQPDYVNGVVEMDTALDPEALLAMLHEIEEEFGRVRFARNAARILDLDLISYGRLIRHAPPILPHPRAAERAFVLYPLSEIAPDWRHPGTGRSLRELIASLPPGQRCRLLEDSSP